MTILPDDLKQEIITFSEKNRSQESCGIIYEKLSKIYFKGCENISDSPKLMFAIDPAIFLEYDVKYIFHSHPLTSEFPSSWDIKNCKIIQIPYIIYSLKTKKFFLIKI